MPAFHDLKLMLFVFAQEVVNLIDELDLTPKPKLFSIFCKPTTTAGGVRRKRGRPSSGKGSVSGQRGPNSRPLAKAARSTAKDAPTTINLAAPPKARNGKRVNWSIGEHRKTLELAVQHYQEHKSFRKASITFEVPRSVLRRRVKAGSLDLHQGPPPALTPAVAQRLANHIIAVGDAGFGMGKPFGGATLTSLQAVWSDSCEVSAIARQIVGHKVGQRDFKASSTWVAAFMKRDSRLSRRRADPLDRLRASPGLQDRLTAFFQLLDAKVKEIEAKQGMHRCLCCLLFCAEDHVCVCCLSGCAMEEEHIFSLDESGLRMNMTRSFVLLRKGSKRAHRVTSSDRNTTSIVDLTSLAGWTAPPYYLFKGVRRPKGDCWLSCSGVILVTVDPLARATPGAGYSMTARGFQTSRSFLEYVRWAITKLPRVADGIWRIWLFDGFSAHMMSEEALKLLYDNRILALCIPSHSSHLIQLQVC
jgi:hypothetical protein